MTLMPVSSISAWVDWSVKVGVGRWIGQRLVALTSPSSSTASPVTLKMRPSTSWPTGTVMGSPVSRTSWPRRRPSVVSMAMVRTMLPPRWLATSRIRLSASSLMRGFDTLSELRMFGTWPGGNSTSTTGPMTWLIRPVAVDMRDSKGVRIRGRQRPT
jgi:hypothetical protein